VGACTHVRDIVCWMHSVTYELNCLMFCWPCIIVYHCNETNVMYVSFNLLRIKSLCMFRAVLAHHQEALHKRHLVCCARIMSVGCGTVTGQQCHGQLTLYSYARSIPNATCEVPPEDEQVMLETYSGLWFSINWMNRASRWFHCTDELNCMNYDVD
jgi:hypothetical protein